MKNPIYYGDFKWAGKVYKGNHESLITKELYDRVQDVMTVKGRRRTRQQKHKWAFQGLLTCGHCGCALTAEIKKQRYVYCHCTGFKGKCPERYVREEEVARQFGEALKAIKIDDEALDWIIRTLKESHDTEKQYHDEMITKLQSQSEQFQRRLEALYLDKLDGLISREFYDQKNTEWRLDQEKILKKIEQHQHANKSYLDEGVRLLELAQGAVIMCENQEMREKRRLLNFVLSNSTWKDGQLHPNYRQPFDMLAETNIACLQKKPILP